MEQASPWLGRRTLGLERPQLWLQLCHHPAEWLRLSAAGLTSPGHLCVRSVGRHWCSPDLGGHVCLDLCRGQQWISLGVLTICWAAPEQEGNRPSPRLQNTAVLSLGAENVPRAVPTEQSCLLTEPTLSCSYQGLGTLEKWFLCTGLGQCLSPSP